MTRDDLATLVGDAVPPARLRQVIVALLDLGILVKYPPLVAGGRVVSVVVNLRVARHVMSYAAAEAERAAVEKEQAGPPANQSASSPAIVWYHGGNSYSTDGQTPILVSPEQHNILKAFLDRDEARDTNALERTGASNVTTVIDKLVEKFGEGAFRRPRKKGEGYFIRVHSLKQSN